MIWQWWRHRRRWRHCFHHDHRTGESWIKQMLQDLGMSKVFWCTRCERHWYV